MTRRRTTSSNSSNSRNSSTAPPPDPLAAFRGGFPGSALSARAITASLEVPGCTRRAVFDAAGVSLDTFAPLLGLPRGEQARHAFSRGNRFEDAVMANNAAELIALLRLHLGLSLTSVRVVDLSAQQVRANHGTVSNPLRATLTRQHLGRMLAGDPTAPTLLRHAMTTLTVGSAVAYLEQDALAVVDNGQAHIVEVKSFPQLDGRADADKAGAAASQSATYALSVLEAADALGYPAQVVSTDALLVLPKNFSNTPVAHVVDLRHRMRRLQRQLALRPTPAQLAALLPAGMCLPDPPAQDAPARVVKAAQRQAADVFTALPNRFGDGCLSCPAFAFCRAEAQRSGAVAQLGSLAINTCGEVASVNAALALARGRRPSGEAEQALADLLTRSRRVRDQVSGGQSA